MIKTVPLLLAALLLLCLFPTGFAEEPAQAPDLTEYYLIPAEATTFDAVYQIMCKNLNLREYPLPEPDQVLRRGLPGGAEYERIAVLQDDACSYAYIGYVCTGEDTREYILWRWLGFQENGDVIGMDVYYTVEGKYIGNIRHNYTAGRSTSSSRCPFRIAGEPVL